MLCIGILEFCLGMDYWLFLWVIKMKVIIECEVIVVFVVIVLNYDRWMVDIFCD